MYTLIHGNGLYNRNPKLNLKRSIGLCPNYINLSVRFFSCSFSAQGFRIEQSPRWFSLEHPGDLLRHSRLKQRFCLLEVLCGVGCQDNVIPFAKGVMRRNGLGVFNQVEYYPSRSPLRQQINQGTCLDHPTSSHANKITGRFH